MLLRLSFLAGLASLTIWPSVAAAQSPGEAADPAEIPLESLFTMEVTTASKFPQKLSQAPGVMSVIAQDELRRFGAMTLREALERVPGLIALAGFFTDRSVVSVRGDQSKENGSHILILINGRPAREILEGGVISDLLQSFPVNILERIEVIRGPGSVLYGSNAFSGVINLITRKATATEAALRNYLVGPGSGGASGELLINRGGWKIVAAGQARYDPTWTTSYRYRETEGPFGPRPALQQVSTRDRGPGAYLGVDYKGLHFSSAYTEWQTGYFLLGLADEIRGRRGFSNLGYTLNPSSRWETSFDLVHTLTRLSSSGFPNIRRTSSDSVLEWSNVIRPQPHDRITFGALLGYVEGRESESLSQPAVETSRGSRRSGGFYGQYDHEVSERWRLTGGFQANKIGPLGLRAVPRAGVVWSPTSHIHIKALYGAAFRAPSLNETRLNSAGLIGNANLKPERVGTFDLGATYQSHRLLAGINFFESRQSAIIFQASISPLQNQYQNTGAVRIRGVEAEVKHYLNDRVLVYGSLLFNARGRAILPTPQWAVSGGASYQVRKTFTATLSDGYHSGVPGYSAALNPPPAGYHMINAHGRFELARLFGERARRMALYAHGVNLGNREIWQADWGGRTGDTVPYARRRTVYYGIEVALFGE
jgi:outer membrane receptor protein involved in Fe transport